MITLLSGGTGTPKLLQGLLQLLPPEEITVIVNTAEDIWLPHGHLSPDIDTVMYTLAGIVNEDTWYGIRGDTFKTHELLVKTTGEMLNIGDEDRKTHVKRGELLRGGKSLTQATKILCDGRGIKSGVLPMSNSEVSTVIMTPVGNLNLHEFLIKHPHEAVNDIHFRGIDVARPTPEAARALAAADKIIIGPSNPITSILPIISLPGVNIKREKCIAVSPIIAGRPVSGPADVFMQAKGFIPDSRGVAEVYRPVISTLVVDEHDIDFTSPGVEIRKTNTIMKTSETKEELARFILEL